MPETGPRIPVSFADRWADPEPGGACHDAFVDIICKPLDELSPWQRAASQAWRYFAEVNNGGHAQYFINLSDDQMARVPEAIRGLRALDMEQAGDILAEAHLRWSGAARLAPVDLHEASAIFGEREFEDLDDRFNGLDPFGREDHTYGMLQWHLECHRDLYVELLPPRAQDRSLVVIGRPDAHSDRGRAAWLSLVAFDNARVRLKAATALIQSDTETAISTLRALADGRPATDFERWPQTRARGVLFDFEHRQGSGS